MRTNIVHPGADELSYEIRGIVEVAKTLEKMGRTISWENIGDPVAKGEEIPAWIREIIENGVRAGKGFRYSETRGDRRAREFIAEMRNGNGCAKLSPDDILFFNGLGDAISIIYTYLNKNARIIGPNPAYPTHSSAEGAHAGSPHIVYRLNPRRNWLPDIEDIRNKVKYNPAVAGILIINPDNPTGIVYPRKVLEEIVDIAREYDLFLIADEVYARLAYDEDTMAPLCELLGDDVPAVIMRGLSKEVPWPGSRCGWIEVYNKDRDPAFARYAQTLVDAKMMEVCSTSLPQEVLPDILGDARYEKHLKARRAAYERRAEIAYQAFRKVPGVVAPKPEGAFYFSVVFEDGLLTDTQTLPIAEQDIAEYIARKSEGAPPDKRFAYYLLGTTGICVVPLSGFNSDLYGFRMTLLEPDETKFAELVRTIAESITAYVGRRV